MSEEERDKMGGGNLFLAVKTLFSSQHHNAADVWK